MALRHRLGLGLCAALSSAHAAAQTTTPERDAAQQAIQSGDHARALALWTAQADAGSFDAMLQLGLMWDRGLGVPATPATAFDWYLRAADGGVAAAQLNVAVMLDAGIGTPADPARALIWYTRAALRGSDRAAYNLGLMFEQGIGTAPHTSLAAHWFGQAAPALTAAQTRIDALPQKTADTELTTPDILFVQLDDKAGEFVWNAASAPDGSRFVLEILPAVGDAAPIVLTTAGSGKIVSPMPDAGPFIWRISQIDKDATTYAASDWQDVPPATRPPIGQVRVSATEESDYLRLLTQDLRQSGLRVTWDIADGTAAATADMGQLETGVSYGFAEDAALAAAVADFLPGLSAGDARFAPGMAPAPGTISLRLITQPFRHIVQNPTGPVR